jgi:hypothetical protein
MGEDDNTSNTTAKTLWSETILEVLYLALKYDKPDKDIREILELVKTKGGKPEYIIQKVNQKLGEEAASRVEALMLK